MSGNFGKHILKTEPYIQIFPFSVNKWANRWIHKNLKFNFHQLMRWVTRKISNNFGKNILETDINIPHFHLSVNKWTNWQIQTNISYFGLTNLWHRSRGKCPAILVKITWKLKSFSNLLSQNISLFHVSVNKWTNWQTHKQKFEI